MALNVSKGSTVNLAREVSRLRVAGVGLGWKPNLAPGGPNFDLDVSAFVLGSNGKVPDDSYVVFYGSDFRTEDGRPQSGDQSVHGAVDSVSGKDHDGVDNEDMRIYFERIWKGIHNIVITVSITKYPNDVHKDRRTLDLNFSMVSDCYIRIWDDETGAELMRYNLREDITNQDAIEFGRFRRAEDDTWEFVATGLSYVGGLPKLIEKFT